MRAAILQTVAILAKREKTFSWLGNGTADKFDTCMLSAGNDHLVGAFLQRKFQDSASNR